jgi:hypothetical protein
VFFGGPRFFPLPPKFFGTFEFCWPNSKVICLGCKKEAQNITTYKIETLTFCSAHIFKTRHPAAATAAAQPHEQQAGRPAPASRTSRQALRPAARPVHNRQHRQAAEQLLQLLAVLVRRPSTPAGPDRRCAQVCRISSFNLATTVGAEPVSMTSQPCCLLLLVPPRPD